MTVVDDVDDSAVGQACGSELKVGVSTLCRPKVYRVDDAVRLVELDRIQGSGVGIQIFLKTNIIELFCCKHN